tara:strand:- start:315 stop:773 length:459 start_codon:yes stop_codon:yes gene_type:complete
MQEFVSYYASKVGVLRIAANHETLTSVVFVNHSNDNDVLPSDLTHECQKQLEAYFSKKLKKFDLPLANSNTLYQHAVRQQMVDTYYGTTTTYQAIAKNINPEHPGPRAVGNVCNKNPFHIIVPCHRVLASNGKLTGYAAGIEKKQWLLAHEQ